MKSFEISKVISIICGLLGFILSLLGLTFGLQSIGAEGWGQLGVIFIMPSVIALIIIVLDCLITVNIIKRGLIYSCISSLIKIGIIVLFIPNTIYNYKYEMKYGVSNLDFDLILIFLLTIVAIPSILNTIKLISLRKNKNRL